MADLSHDNTAHGPRSNDELNPQRHANTERRGAGGHRRKSLSRRAKVAIGVALGLAALSSSAFMVFVSTMPLD